MINPQSSRPTLHIDLGAVIANYEALAEKAAPAKVGASVKADAYGLGARAVGRALYKSGCRTFFVAHGKEGKSLRTALPADAEIYVLSGPTPGGLGRYFEADFKPVINSADQARLWISACNEAKYPPACALHFDTVCIAVELGIIGQANRRQNKAVFRRDILSNLFNPLVKTKIFAHGDGDKFLRQLDMNFINIEGIAQGRRSGRFLFKTLGFCLLVNLLILSFV